MFIMFVFCVSHFLCACVYMRGQCADAGLGGGGGEGCGTHNRLTSPTQLPHLLTCLLSSRVCLPASPSPSPQDLLLPEESLGFVTSRCPLADLEEEELGPFLPGKWLHMGWLASCCGMSQKRI